MKLATSLAVLAIAGSLLYGNNQSNGVEVSTSPADHDYILAMASVHNSANLAGMADPLGREVVVDDALDFTLDLSTDADRPAQLGADDRALYAAPGLDEILEAAARAWPEQPDKAGRVAVCELGADVVTGAYPAAVVFDVTRRTGGPMQIDAPTWAPYFADRWDWPTVVLDLEAHFAAAREIYDRSGNWRPWPICGLR